MFETADECEKSGDYKRWCHFSNSVGNFIVAEIAQPVKKATR
jgi:hypothetical protein